MNFGFQLVGVLALAVPLFAQKLPATDPTPGSVEPLWFLLNETKDQVTRALGNPTFVAEFGQDFRSWQYQIGDIDHHDFSHVVVFRKSDGTIVSVTRNYEPERNVDALFPEPETTVYHYPDAQRREYSLRLRRLSGGRVLMAMGTSAPGQVTGQIVLMRQSELRFFYPWLYQQLPARSRIQH